jgi:hypothetical protein
LIELVRSCCKSTKHPVILNPLVKPEDKLISGSRCHAELVSASRDNGDVILKQVQDDNGGEFGMTLRGKSTFAAASINIANDIKERENLPENQKRNSKDFDIIQIKDQLSSPVQKSVLPFYRHPMVIQNLSAKLNPLSFQYLIQVPGFHSELVLESRVKKSLKHTQDNKTQDEQNSSFSVWVKSLGGLLFLVKFIFAMKFQGLPPVLSSLVSAGLGSLCPQPKIRYLRASDFNKQRIMVNPTQSNINHKQLIQKKNRSKRYGSLGVRRIMLRHRAA